jgi:hypothetical protein
VLPNCSSLSCKGEVVQGEHAFIIPSCDKPETCILYHCSHLLVGIVGGAFASEAVSLPPCRAYVGMLGVLLLQVLKLFPSLPAEPMSPHAKVEEEVLLLVSCVVLLLEEVVLLSLNSKSKE